jgi:hypothetical protein
MLFDAGPSRLPHIRPLKEDPVPRLGKIDDGFAGFTAVFRRNAFSVCAGADKHTFPGEQ